MSGIEEWIEGQRAELQAVAKEAVDQFWRTHMEHATKGDKAEYGVRVKRRGKDGTGGIAIEWFRYRFVKRNKGWMKFKESIARNGGYRYTRRELSKMEPWEWAAALEVEDVAEVIRKQNEALTRMGYLAREYAKRQETLGAAIGEEVE